MSAQRLFEVIGMVDDELLEEAERYRTPYKERHWARWGALAACAMLVIGGAFMGRVVFGGASSSAPTGGAPAPAPSAAPSATPSDAPAEGIPGASPTPGYAGAILPLTAEGGLDGLTAEREVTYTVDAAEDSTAVADRYVLTNATDKDKTLTLYYPYVSSLTAPAPTLTMDGAKLETGLLLGAYAGAAPDRGNAGVPSGFEDDKALLESGAYLQAAKEDALLPDCPVTVYTFHDIVFPADSYDTAAIVLEFTLPEDSRVLSWRLNDTGSDEETRQCSLRFTAGTEGTEQRVIVLGTPPASYRVTGYTNNSATQENPEVTARVEVAESTLYAEVKRCLTLWGQVFSAAAHLPEEARMGAVLKLVEEPEGSGVSWNDLILLEDTVSIALSMRRVLYRTAEIAVPAGGAVELTASYQKDKNCDLATTLGSSLTFTAQQAKVELPPGWELGGQSFGFDLAHGISEVVLDLNVERYYLEIRKPEE